MKTLAFHIGIDGGGSGTRASVRDLAGTVLGTGASGPSALSQGIDQAWRNIGAAISMAFARAGIEQPTNAALGVAIGVSGAEIEAWRRSFLAANPGFGQLLVATDGTTSLLGAHQGAPGAMIACGTGLIGEALHADGRRVTVSGWGFPYGDEGGGAWIGQRALAVAMQAIDGRLPASLLSEAVRAKCGADRVALTAWSLAAGQAELAALAPIVFECSTVDPMANDLLNAAVAEIDRVALALDPSQTLPMVVLGSIGRRIANRMLGFASGRHVLAKGSSIDGAFMLFDKRSECWS